VLQCVAVCCSVLQCVATGCNVLQCVASISHIHETPTTDIQERAVCCSVLQCVAVSCSVLRRVATAQRCWHTMEKADSVLNTTREQYAKEREREKSDGQKSVHPDAEKREKRERDESEGGERERGK